MFHEYPKTVAERLQPTVDIASEKLKLYRWKGRIIHVHMLSSKIDCVLARRLSIALNIAIALQIVLGALITSLAAISFSRASQISTSLLGALTTIVASFLARLRGSGEPDLSRARARELEHVRLGAVL